MKRITSTNGCSALVSSKDYQFLSQYSWSRHLKGYFICNNRGPLKGQKMHRVVATRMGLDIEGLQIDHKDRDPSNNRRGNLRVALHGQNRANSGLNSNNKSGYKGVHFRPALPHLNSARKRRSDAGVGIWYAQINVEGKKIYLGSFKTAEEAHAAYEVAALEHFGEFANPAKRE